MTIPSYIKIWLKDALWHAEVGGWICMIHGDDHARFPFSYYILNATEGQGGPARSFAEARQEVDGILARKGLRVPRKQNAIPGLEL